VGADLQKLWDLQETKTPPGEERYDRAEIIQLCCDALDVQIII